MKVQSEHAYVVVKIPRRRMGAEESSPSVGTEGKARGLGCRFIGAAREIRCHKRFLIHRRARVLERRIYIFRVGWLREIEIWIFILEGGSPADDCRL